MHTLKIPTEDVSRGARGADLDLRGNPEKRYLEKKAPAPCKTTKAGYRTCFFLLHLLSISLSTDQRPSTDANGGMQSESSNFLVVLGINCVHIGNLEHTAVIKEP